MSLALLGFSLCILMPCWSVHPCLGLWSLFGCLTLLLLCNHFLQVPNPVHCRGFGPVSDSVSEEGSLMKNPFVNSQLAGGSDNVLCLGEALGACPFPGLFLRSSLWEANEVCVLTTAFLLSLSSDAGTYYVSTPSLSNLLRKWNMP